MKTLKTSLAGLLALTIIGSASAQTPVHITGSTAFRGNTLAAIMHILGSTDSNANSNPKVPGTLPAGSSYGFVGTDFFGSKFAIFNGSVNGTPVTIKTSWSGSEGGIQTVSNNLNVTFLPDGAGASQAGTPSDADPSVSGNSNESTVPDVAMSDTFQSSSQFFGTFRNVFYQTLNSSATTSGIPAGQIVGIIPFKFVASKGAPAGLTNITTNLARNLFGAGSASLSLFTGNSGDHTQTVVATGRDFDSGTRISALTETGIGAKTTVRQFEPDDANGTLIKTAGGTAASLAVWHTGTSVNGIPFGAPGNGGYSSGGDMCKGLNNIMPANSILIGYSGIGDADAQIGTSSADGIVELSYNGVKLGKPENSALIAEGQYSFWGYEHLLYRDNTGASVKAVADTLANQIENGATSGTPDAPDPLFTAMKVNKSTDGAKAVQTFAENPVY